MDNPEELLHSLAEFVKLKPKEIPADLEQYLSYVAKTGDPIYQWPLVKALFREKLLNVITEFYETCPTSADPAPACPNVDFFNYETMKVGLVERLESFASAPFTVQRLCELLTAPRKQYSRADKFMRAVEKNMLVVSTREPGLQRVGQDVDIANGEDKSWMSRQPVAASVDRAPGLELAAFRYEPFGSSPGTAFFPPLKQKLDDFLETDAAVSAIAPQAANLANLAAISPEQVASLAATIGPDVANLAVEISPEVANLAAEIPPDVANLAAEIPPDVANLAAEIPPEVANLAVEISPDVANLAAEIPPEVASLASAISPEVASLAAEIAPVVANLAAQIPPEVASLAVELTPLIDAANTTTDDVAGSANPTAPAESREPGLPLQQPEEKMDVTEPTEEAANQGAAETEATNHEAPSADLSAADEPPANQVQDEKMSVDEDEDTTIPANHGQADTLAANQQQEVKTPANQDDADKTPANQGEAPLAPANQEGAETVAVETEKPVAAEGGVQVEPAANESTAGNEATNQSEAEKIAPNESEAEKTTTDEMTTEIAATNDDSAEKQQEDRRQVQSERVQSVIRETLDREDSGPPAKVPRMEDTDS